MKTLFLYTFNTIRRNRTTSFSIMLAILLASALLCALCTFGYTQLKWQVEIEEYEDGQWHGELGGEITSDKLGMVENNLNVDETMVKGPYSCLALSEGSDLPYLLLRDADENYWDSMGEKNTIMEGRVPGKPGEIAVSKSFFEQNPQYRLGDTITLPEGERRISEKALDAAEVRREGESFFQTGEKTVTLVGKMDLTTTTVVPGYYAMGYMDRSALTGEEELVVYVKLRDIRKTYEVMPQIAEALGIEKDEYGTYENHFRYHTMLLTLNFVFPPEMEFSLGNWGGVISYGLLVLLAAGAFVMIIKGAFQVSVSARIKQLGMFRSIGATPGQIVASVLMEGIVLSVLPIILSIGIGYFFMVAVVEIYTEIAKDLLYFPVTVRFTPYLALLTVVLSLLTVLASALLPAIKASRLSPLEAIRMQEAESGSEKKRRKKSRNYPVLRRLFGYPGQLAGASHYAGRKGFRAGVMSLTLCLVLLAGFFVMMSLNDCTSERNRKADYYNIYVRLDSLMEADRELLAEIQAVSDESVYYCENRMAYYASPEQETEEFRSQGGFAGLNPNKWGLVEREGRYRVRTYLYGLQEDFFDDYCRSLGEDPAGYYDTEKIKVLVRSAAPVYPNVVNNPVKSDLSYSHLNISKGEELLLEEKTEDDMKTDYTFLVTAGAVADKEPELGEVRNNYNLNLYVPLSVYYSIMEKLSGEKAGTYYNTYIKVRTTPENDIAVTDKITELCESAMATEDVIVVSAAKERETNAVGARAMEAVVDCIGLLLGLIGVSNTLSAVSHVMMRRRREFAMLRSVGMDNRGIEKLLFIEAVRMAVTPVLIAIPATFALLFALMAFIDVSWKEMLPFMPWGKVFLSIVVVTAAVAVSYLFSAGRIKKDTIIEAVREENV